MPELANCPQCQAPIPPGQQRCRSCGYNFQAGRQRSGFPMLAAGFLLGGAMVCLLFVLVAAGLILWGPGIQSTAVRVLERFELGTATRVPTPVERTSTVVPSSSTPRGQTLPTPAPTPTPVVQPEWEIVKIEQEKGKGQVVLKDGRNAYVIVKDAALDPSYFEKWELESVSDMTGDGLMDAVVWHYSGGAHCCSDYSFFGSEPGGIRLYDAFSLGNGGINEIGDLDGDKIPEIIAGDDRFAYFGDLSYAESPWLLLVLCRSKEGTYEDCSRKFPQYLQEMADYYEDHLRNPDNNLSDANLQNSDALGLLAAYIRLGKAEEGWKRVRAYSPAAEPWLRKYLPDIENVLAADLLDPSV